LYPAASFIGVNIRTCLSVRYATPYSGTTMLRRPIWLHMQVMLLKITIPKWENYTI